MSVVIKYFYFLNYGSHRGLSFLEIMIATLVIGVIIIPIYSLFSTSRRMGATAKNVMTGMGCAVSYVSALKEIDIDQLVATDRTKDTDLVGALGADNLQIMQCVDGFTRYLEIEKDFSRHGLAYALVKVEVTWNNPITNQPQRYLLKTLMREK